MSKYEREPWARPKIESVKEEPAPNLEIGARTRLGREVVAKTSFGIITGAEPRNGFLRINRNPEQENKERNDE